MDISSSENDSGEMARHLEDRLQEAIKDGLPAEYQQELQNMLFQYRVTFRTKLSAAPPADVSSMLIRLKGDAVLIRVNVQTYSPPQSLFLCNKVDVVLTALSLIPFLFGPLSRPLES